MKLVQLILCGLALSFGVNGQVVKKVEPQNWWAGMAEPSLQLLLYGDNLAQYQVKLVDSKATLAKVHRVENPNYLFVDLTLSPSIEAGDLAIELWRDNNKIDTIEYPIWARTPGSQNRAGFSNKDSIYLITPDRFANGDLNNDEVSTMSEGIDRSKPGGRHGGDLQGIIDNLDYVADMGFTQIWLNPVLENAMESYSYHGYSTTDYYQVDPRYGSNELYKTLSQRAQEKGIGLIMDVILNHIGSNHWWMKDMPMKDWTNHQGKFVGTNHLREALHDPNSAEIDKRGFDDGWFVPTMPDLNQKNPYVAKYLTQNAIWWVEYAGLSGIRVDTYSYPDKQFLSQWTKSVMAEYPNLNIVGEEWSVNPAITAYWQKGSKRYDDYESALPSVFDFALQDAVVQSLKEQDKWNTGWIKTYKSLANDFLYGDPSNLVTFPDNHDMTRIHSFLNEDADLTKMALAFFATTRGIPQYYYGSEILMTAVDDHGLIRSDFPGGWPTDKTNAFTGKGLNKEQKGAQSYLKRILNFRKSEPLLHDGKLLHYGPRDGVYVYFRYDTNTKDRIMVLMNKTDKPVSVALDRFEQLLKGQDYRATNVMNGNSFALKDHVKAAAKQATILKLMEQ